MKTMSIEFKDRQRGAAFLEFVLALPVFLIMFSLVIDGGVYMYRYLRVTHITNIVAREMATATAQGLHESHATSVDCNIAASFACTKISDVYSKTGDKMLKDVDFYINGISIDNWGGLPLLVVEGRLTRSCIACFYLPSSFQARSQEIVAFETEIPLGSGCPLTTPVHCP